jgi:hypothetical protein
MAEALPGKAVPFDEAMKQANQEKDRVKLEPGISAFYITAAYFTSETQFDKIAKVNGVASLNAPPGDLLNIKKFRTTSKGLVNQLNKMLSNQQAAGNVQQEGDVFTFKVPVGPVTVINYQPEDPMGNPKKDGAGNVVPRYYKFVAAEPGKV